MFRKAWDYIKNIDLNKALHIDVIKSKSNVEFIEHLVLTINFYEVLEEYEKCAHLKTIQNKVEEFLP